MRKSAVDRKRKNRAAMCSVKIFSISVLMLSILFCGQAVAVDRCNPLLIMISGAGFLSGGTAMPDLAVQLEKELTDHGIAIISLQNGLFTDGNTVESKLVQRIADKIKGSEYSPIVVIGHSWGAVSALAFAVFVEVDLVVTFDAVLRGDLPFPGLAKYWINVFTKDWGWWRLGGARDYINEASENIHVETEHSDVVGMFNPVSRKIYDALLCPDGSYHPEGMPYKIPERICDEIDGVSCTITWNIRDRCVDQKGLEVKFYSMVKDSSEPLDTYGPFKINPGGELNRSLKCRIGTKVCYGASSSERTWGLWPPHKEWEDCDCCEYCLSTRKTVTQSTNLICN